MSRPSSLEPPGDVTSSFTPQLLTPKNQSVAHLGGSQVEGEENQTELLMESPPVVSLMDILPPELVARIFISCLPNSHYIVPDRTTAPLLLTQICSPWRMFALQTSMLWSSAFLRITDSHIIHKSQSLLNILREWLSRSGTCLISLSIDHFVSPHFLHSVVDIATDLVSVAAPHSHRWKRIFLHVPNTCLDPLGRLNESATPMLEVLELNEAIIEPDGPLSRLTMLSNSPRLHTLALLQIAPSVQLALPWPSLTSLFVSSSAYGRCWSASQWLNVLALAPNLSMCTLAVSGVQDGRLPVHPVTLQDLCALRVDSRHSVGLGMLLDGLVLPDLMIFEVKVHSGSWPHSEITSMIKRSECLIYYSTLEGMIGDASQIIQFLFLTPWLCELSFSPSSNSPGITETLLSAMTIRSSVDAATQLVPNLTSLKLYDMLNFSKQSLSRLVRSRWDDSRPPGTKRLMQVTLHPKRFSWLALDPSNLDLEGCVEQGLRLDLRLS
ncbi:hypothetical protein JAAARDRAFT_74613 [Jaapia argillacea MUCL 33604]|uniref:F-box domain-containing protein n=1 Tax=Jaapia argillacea MUCL 33604 TaxID=933084 RepID=A0A067PEX1_9AGAM|nr:hypothetical protein JAAARDRAFT_74613 [Jaapia argillacea MUCL 33604]